MIHILALSLLLVSSFEAREYCIRYEPIPPGLTCYQIGKNYGKTISDLYNMNPGLTCFNLIPGDKLCVAVADLEKLSCTRTHKVVAGDICYNIWNKNGLVRREFMEMNRGVDCDVLQIGQNLCVSIT